MGEQTFVVIAAYNEQEMIGQVVRSLAPLAARVVVVDDGSGDESGERAFEAGATVLRHPLNLGQGAALQTGIDFALGKGAEYIVTFDADGQHAASDIGGALEALRRSGVDVVLGSRFLGRAIDMPAAKRLVLRLAVAFTRVTTGLKLTDTHNGFRVLTRSAAERIKLRQNRMSHASDLLSQIAELKLRYEEYPVEVRYTEYSRRKGQPLTAAFHILVDSAVGRMLK
ncbi:MAG TPA: glycosyltransferase family 2 protein [Phycisphaerae bacterium]|nr:glycosyltransferase family 2 protein [Phycisphaerae bacterium]